MADDRWNEDQERISDDNVVGKAADESDGAEDIDEFDDESDSEEDEDVDEQ